MHVYIPIDYNIKYRELNTEEHGWTRRLASMYDVIKSVEFVIIFYGSVLSLQPVLFPCGRSHAN